MVLQLFVFNIHVFKLQNVWICCGITVFFFQGKAVCVKQVGVGSNSQDRPPKTDNNPEHQHKPKSTKHPDTGKSNVNETVIVTKHRKWSCDHRPPDLAKKTALKKHPMTPPLPIDLKNGTKNTAYRPFSFLT